MKLQYNDAQHAYWLDGKRCKSISAVAKIPDDTYSLEQWRKRMLLVGIATLPQLVEQAAAHFDDRDHLDRIAEQALQAARSHDAANRGTAAHRIAERVDLAEIILDSPQARAVTEAWQKALDIAGLEIIPELVERVVVWPDRFIAGRFDRVARRKADGRHVMVDLKTGANAVKYPHAVAVQLALYANAPLMAGPIPREGGTTTVFGPLPDMDRSVGYVIHMPSDGEVDVLGVDLEKAYAGMVVCFEALDWRACKDLLLPVTEVPVEVMDRADWIRGRLAKIAGHGVEAKAMMARRWPEGVPTRPPWDNAQVDLLDEALGKVEAGLGLPFGDPDPTGRYATMTATNP